MAMVILVAYLWQWAKKKYGAARKSGLTPLVIDEDEWSDQNTRGRRHTEKWVPKQPPTPRTRAMMKADPDFNPNNPDHRILSLEALDRTSSALLKMNNIKINMPVVTEESDEKEATFDFPVDQDSSESPSGGGMPG